MSITRSRATTVAILLALVAALLSGCMCARPPRTQPQPGPSPTPTQAPTPEPPAPQSLIKVRLYFVEGEKIGVVGREVERTTETAGLVRGAIDALLAGPTAGDVALGMGTAIPGDTAINEVEVDGDTATVDLSRAFESGGGTLSMSLRIAQIVYTATQFDGVEKVVFELDGTPVEAIGGEGLIVEPFVKRSDCEDVTPAILVESPLPGDVVSSPVAVSGTANVFEAQLNSRIRAADGTVLATQQILATAGTGTRGTFETDIGFDASSGDVIELMVYDISAKDGSEIDVVSIPLAVE